MTKTAAVYIRQSQTHEGTISPELQRKNVESFIVAQGWSIYPEVYEDIDISGLKTENRPDFLRLRSDYEAGKFDIAVADDFSRFSREKEDAFGLLKNMKIATAKEGYDESGDDFIPALHFILAAKFSKDMGKRWNHALMHRLEKGLPPSGKTQFGYDKTADGHYVQNPEQAAILREAYDRYTNGEGVRSICADFSTRGLPAPGSRGWYSGGMFDLLDKQFYAGKIVWTPKKGEEPLVVPGAHEAILSPGEWSAYRKAREDRKLNIRPKNPRWMLSGLVECGLCGGKMVSHSDSRGKKQLMCGTYTAHGKQACSGVFRRQSIVTTRVWFWLGGHLEEWASAMPTNEEARKAAEKAVSEAKAAHEAAEADYSRYADWAYENGILASVSAAKLAEKAEAVKATEAAIEDAQAHLAGLIPASDVHDRILEGSKLMGFSEDPDAEISEGTTARFREALSQIIETVIVLPSTASSPRAKDRNHAEEIKIVPRKLA